MKLGIIDSTRKKAGAPAPPSWPFVITFEDYDVGDTSGTGEFEGTWTCHPGYNAEVRVPIGPGLGTYEKCIWCSAAAFSTSIIFTNDRFGWNIPEVAADGFNFRLYGATQNEAGLIQIHIDDTTSLNITSAPSINGWGTIQTGTADFTLEPDPYTGLCGWYGGQINGGFGTTGVIEIYKLEIYKT